MTYYLDYSDGGSGTTSPNSARLDELGEFRLYAREEDDDELPWLDQGDDEEEPWDLKDEDKPEEVAQCCCKVQYAHIRVMKNEEERGYARSRFRVKVRMSYKPGDENPDKCSLVWEERTSRTYHVPPRTTDGAITATPPEDEIEVPQGPTQPGAIEPDLTPEWVDVSKQARKTPGWKNPGAGVADEPSWNDRLPTSGCPERVIWRKLDEPGAPKKGWPRTLQVKITIKNGASCAASTVLKFRQHINGQGRVTTDPSHTSGNWRNPGVISVEPGTEQPDPEGWLEPKAGDKDAKPKDDGK